MTNRDRFLSIRVPDVAVAMYIVASVVASDGSVVSQVARVILIGVACTEFISKPRLPKQLLIWQMLFVGYVVASITWAYSVSHAESIALTVVINGLCIVALGYLVLDDPQRVRLVVACLMIAPIILMIRVGVTDGFLAYMFTRDADSAHANLVGMTAAFGFAFSYLCSVRKMMFHRLFAVALLVGNLSVVLLSASRKAAVMVLLVVLLFTLLNRTARSSPIALQLAGLALVGAVGYWLIMNTQMLYLLIGHRLEALLNGLLGQAGQADASTSTRFALIDRGLVWFRESPMVGYGGDNFRALMQTYYPGHTSFYAHNNFIELLVDYGVIGLVLFYWIYFAIIAKGLKNLSLLDPLQSMFLALVVSLLVMEYGQVDYYSRFFMSFIAVSWVVLSTNTVVSGDRVSGTSRSMTSRHP